jgi:hypothetical protein
MPSNTDTYRWPDEEFIKWIDLFGKGTKPSYEKGLELWITFLKYRYRINHTPKTLIDEIEEDRKKSRRKQGVIESRIIAFYKYLRYDHVSKGRYGKEKKVGLSENRATAYVMSIRSFYMHNRFPLIPGALPKSAIPIPETIPENEKHDFTMKEIKQMVTHPANSPLDKAILIFQPQSMMDTSTLSTEVRFKTLISGFKEIYAFPSKNFIEPLIEALRSTSNPLILNVKRVKTGKNYTTFVGKDSCHTLADYLQWEYIDKDKKKHPQLNDIVFIHENKPLLHGTGLTKQDYISPLWKTRAIQIGLISEAGMASSDINPARPHGGRAAISDILKDKIAESLVEHWMGHTIDKVKIAYALKMQAHKDVEVSRKRKERMREIYHEHEYLIAINIGSEK